MSKMTSLERIKRLLSVLPWIESQNGPYIDEVVARFDYPKQELIEDLENVVFFVGVYPFTPDCLIEVSVSDERVWVRYADWFRQPMKLDSREVALLSAAGKAVAEFNEILHEDSQDELTPLDRALAKLSTVQEDSENFLEIKLATPTKWLSEIQSAVKHSTVLEIEYLSTSRNEVTVRKIEPEKIFASSGKWYLHAYCQKASENRTFRLDRIKKIKILDEVSKTKTDNNQLQDDFSDLEHFPIVLIELPASDKHLVDSFPGVEIETISKEKIRVQCHVASEGWLKQVLISLGGKAEVVKIPREFEENIRSMTAKEILKRYTS